MDAFRVWMEKAANKLTKEFDCEGATAAALQH